MRKYREPMDYKLTIEQLEILCVGSDLLDKEYYKKKEIKNNNINMIPSMFGIIIIKFIVCFFLE